ncbi:glycosyltransferase family A protein [Candidatus Accumulibacter sp. ACC003]|uniref:glycosyltransferase family 2 protein n=1 Tax=Candidatus Accumulibacter sp. ACC003 TaxID=2823334 RepID=UPI0025BBFFB0|nr:glycosyltransferase family A protein [Candidatus Accumulibacter sp. ACC003]
MFNREVLAARRHPSLASVQYFEVLRRIKTEFGDKYYFYFTNHGVLTNIEEHGWKHANSGSPSAMLKHGGRLFRDRESVSSLFLETRSSEAAVLLVAFANYYLARGSVTGYLRFINEYLTYRNISGISFVDLKSGDIPTFRNWVSTICKKEVGLLPTDGKPKVSIIMPAFNNGSTIRWSILSIVNQSFADWELLVVDDASTDNTAIVVSDLAKSDKRISLIQNSANIGTYLSRNRALRVALGEYVTVLDADDFAVANRLELQYKQVRLAASPGHIGGYVRMNEDCYLTDFRKASQWSYDGVTHRCLASIFLNREFLLNRLGRWDAVRFGGDAELYARALKIDSDTFVESRAPLIIALNRCVSLTNSPGSELGSAARQAYIDHFSRWHESAHQSELRLPEIAH